MSPRYQSLSKIIRDLVLLGVVFVAPNVFVAPAKAATLGFDDLCVGDVFGGVPFPQFYQGFFWKDFFANNSPSTPASGYHNGVVSAPCVAYDTGIAPGLGSNAASASFFLPSNGTTFILNSGYFTAAWNDGLEVIVTGSLGGVVEDTATFNVDTSGPTFETFNWSNLDEVTIASTGGTHHAGFIGIGPQFVLDNLTVNEAVTTTPEPTSLLLFGTGLLSLMGVVRRKLFS
jgi:PEP-CTERM motif